MPDGFRQTNINLAGERQTHGHPVENLYRPTLNQLRTHRGLPKEPPLKGEQIAQQIRERFKSQKEKE